MNKISSIQIVYGAHSPHGPAKITLHVYQDNEKGIPKRLPGLKVNFKLADNIAARPKTAETMGHVIRGIAEEALQANGYPIKLPYLEEWNLPEVVENALSKENLWVSITAEPRPMQMSYLTTLIVGEGVKKARLIELQEQIAEPIMTRSLQAQSFDPFDL